MAYKLRDFLPPDAAEVNEVVRAAFAEYRDAFSDWEALTKSFDSMVAMADTSEIIVAEYDGQIVGAVAYVPAGMPKKAFYPAEWPIMRMLVVHPIYRGHGIGKALAEACIKRAERDEAELIALHTSHLMKIALPMYKRMGFEKVREAPVNFGVPYDIYVKHLHSRRIENRGISSTE